MKKSHTNGTEFDRMRRGPVRGNNDDDPAGMYKWLLMSSFISRTMFQESPRYLSIRDIRNGKHRIKYGKWERNMAIQFRNDGFLDDIGEVEI